MSFHKSDSLNHMFFHVIRLQHYRMQALLDKVGIYPGQPPMLHALHRKDGQSQKELANKLGVKPSTITVMLRRMEKGELVERRQDADDQRISRVYLTEKGKKAWIEVKEIMKDLEAECFGNFTDEDQDLLRRLLMQMYDNLAKVCDKKLEL